MGLPNGATIKDAGNILRICEGGKLSPLSGWVCEIPELGTSIIFENVSFIEAESKFYQWLLTRGFINIQTK